MKKIIMILFITISFIIFPESIEIKTLKKSAEDGNSNAQFNLGVMYSNGDEVLQDYNKALYWYKKAAEDGVPSAQYNLGVMYDKGYGVLQDYSKALYWYKKAAENGQLDAQYNLGIMYFKGYGVPQDYSKAYAWLNIAAVNDEEARNLRAIIIKELSPGQIEEGQKLSQEIYNKIYN